MAGGRGPSALAVAGVVTAAGVVVLLVGWAAAIGPNRVVSGGIPNRGDRVLPTPSSAFGSGSGGEFVPAEHPFVSVVATVLVLAGVLLVLALVALLAVRLVRTFRWPRRRVPPTPDVDFDVLSSPRVLVETLTEDWDHQLELLSEGSPRNAIVSAWHRFETLAEDLGHTRELWETSAEFTLRILDLARADAAAVSRLSGLYREARFSEHELGDDARAAAVSAVDAIHRSLREGAGTAS